MTISVPNPVARVLYNTAKRVGDELGKAQETLRVAKGSIITTGAETKRAVLLIPDVDIVVVGVRCVAAGAADAADTAEVVAPADGEDLDVAAGSTNRLITQISNPSTAEDTVLDATLTGLNGNVVRAGQPIVAIFIDNADGGVTWYTQVSYVLADDARTF